MLLEQIKKHLIQYKREAIDIAKNLREGQAYAGFKDSSESIYGMWFTICD